MASSAAAARRRLRLRRHHNLCEACPQLPLGARQNIRVAALYLCEAAHSAGRLKEDVGEADFGPQRGAAVWAAQSGNRFGAGLCPPGVAVEDTYLKHCLAHVGT